MNIVTDVEPKTLPRQYYDFENYISKERIVTYWYQLKEISSFAPGRMLEIGKGSGLVAHAAGAFDIQTTTVDINPSLKPDYCASVLDLASVIKDGPYDVVLCARVLHHLEHQYFETALKSLASVARHVVLTLPREDFRMYFSFRLTSKRDIKFSLPLTLFLKKMIMKLTGQDQSYYAKTWKIDSSAETSLANVNKSVEKYFSIQKQYGVPEDLSHYIYVLRVK